MAMATSRGGLMRVLETLAAEQVRHHEVLVASPLSPRTGPEASGVRWHELRLSGNADVAGHRRLRALLRREAPDAVILHAGSPGELALATALAARFGAAAVIEHAPEHYPLRRPWRDTVLASCKRRADRWLCVSAAGARHLRRLWRLPDGVPGVLYSGVPESVATPPDGALAGVVLGAGRPTAAKGYDTFREIARALAVGNRPPRFVWIGAAAPGRDGPLELLPWRDHLGPALAACRLVLLPSRVEGVPLLLLEAWAAGAPVVASAVGGVPEVVTDGVDGMLVGAGNLAGWVAATGALLADAGRRRQLATAGHSRWRGEFTAAAMAARWQTVLDGLEARR